ncbi:MAG: hypothetical protein ACLFPL_02080 [Candidatus Nanoarchaeia archaeon]
MSSKTSKDILPPTGFMLTSTLLEREDAYYSKKLIEEGISRDYKFGNNVMRSVCSKSNGTPRNYGESEFLRTELDSVEAIREFARRFDINIKSLSNIAQKAINLGYVPEDERSFHMKELNFEEEENPLILFSKRRKSTLESKIGKSLERIARYRNSEIGKRDEGFEMLKSSLNRLEEELGYDLLSWRASRDTPFELCDVCTTDFAAVTYVVNSTQYDIEEDEIIELKDKNEIRKRMDLIRTFASQGANRIAFNGKDNFTSDQRDRAISFYTQNPKTNATFETRIITPRDFIEATIGDRSHDGYKMIQIGKIEEQRRIDPQFATLLERALEFTKLSSLNELYSK